MILQTVSQRRALLDRSKTVAMVGASPNPTRPSYFVFSYLRTKGLLEVAPINPMVAEIDGIEAYPTLAAYAAKRGAPDIVDVFRKPADAPSVVREAIAAGAKAVWFQYGVINEEAIRLADDAGLDVVVDRCLKVESARFDGGLSIGGLNSGLITSKRTPARSRVSDEQTHRLDDAFLGMVADWREGRDEIDEARFDAHARALFAYQFERNVPYRRYVESLGGSDPSSVTSWRAIPAVPSSAFKDASLATFDVSQSELIFHTSGTTAERSGKHYVEHARLYDAALLAGFDRFMLPDRPKLRYLNLVPNPRFRPHSSLGYMMGHVSVLRGEGKAQYFLDDDAVDVTTFVVALDAAVKAAQPVCVAGTAFAFATLIDALAQLGRSFEAPAGSRVMETGGFKGRTRVIERPELYAGLSAALGIPEARIVAEYGMTELLSQYYDAPASRANEPRVKVAPPWLRPLVVDGNGREVAPGDVGFLRHVDLANRSSVVAIDTEDRGYVCGDGIVLLGREIDAPARGCSLDAEDLAASRA